MSFILLITKYIGVHHLYKMNTSLTPHEIEHSELTKRDFEIPIHYENIVQKIEYTFNVNRIISLCVCMKHFPEYIYKYVDNLLSHRRFIKLIKILKFTFEKSIYSDNSILPTWEFTFTSDKSDILLIKFLEMLASHE